MDIPSAQHETPRESETSSRATASPTKSSVSLRELWQILRRRRIFVAAFLGSLLLVCFLYCLAAPNEYEASAKVALRATLFSPLSLKTEEPLAAASIVNAPVQQETLANALRSDQLAWRVISDLKLYREPAFMGRFQRKFPDFRPETPTADAQEYLLKRFAWRLNVQTIPRTLLVQIRFRCGKAMLSAAVVNSLIDAYSKQESEARAASTAQASQWLVGQLKDLQARGDRDRQRLAVFQNEHGILSTPETLANGMPGEVQHAPELLEVDELGRQQAAATADRILREAEYRAASQGDPELVIASDPRLQSESSSFATGVLQQIHARHSELEVEQAQLGIERGPNYPRVVEIRGQLKDLDRQILVEDAKLVERFRKAWQTAQDREELVRKNLMERVASSAKLNQAAAEYAAMRQEASTSHELYLRVLAKLEESDVAIGIPVSSISVVDAARPPAKPVAPNLPLYLAITLFAGLWLAGGGVLLMESLGSTAVRAALAMLAVLLSSALAQGQAPTPNTQGLPTGVARIPLSTETRNLPNPKDAPAVWNNPGGASPAGLSPQAGTLAESPLPAPIGPGDFLDVSEYRTPEFHTVARVSPAGTVMLPLAEEVQVGGLDERAAARAIEAALIAQGMLLHPQVSVMVTAYAGQDVSVLGEVARPGVYPYTLHHRLLDVISAASGLAPSAGRLVNIFHRSDPKTPHPVVLDPSATDTAVDHNPELAPGDTVQVSRAGLVYVIGDVIRPGGFPVDPAQGLTIVQALSLAWGPNQNAATGKALLIREQKGGRTLTTLNLKRLLHGQEPDQPVYDRDILFVPDSTAKNLWNRTMEAAIQSAVGVTIYSALVYSQRY